jgi:hypothetical protein
MSDVPNMSGTLLANYIKRLKTALDDKAKAEYLAGTGREPIEGTDLYAGAWVFFHKGASVFVDDAQSVNADWIMLHTPFAKTGRMTVPLTNIRGIIFDSE